MKVSYFIYGLFAAGLLVLYGLMDPAVFPFPRCPLLTYTGIRCPGCGSQRAMHQLLHGNFSASFTLNALFIPALLYAAFGYGLALLAPRKWPAVRSRWFGIRAAQIALVIIVVFWVSRNLIPGL